MHLCVHTDNKEYHEKEELLLNVSSSTPVYSNVKYNANALNNAVWAGNEPVYWSLESDYEFIHKDVLKDVIKGAFLEPSFETPLVIRNRSTADAQIKIKFLKKVDEPYFTSNSILAFGYGPGKGIGGDITMNADVGWWLGPKITMKEAKELGMIDSYQDGFGDNIYKTYDPLHTLKHEGGHALGMRHLTDSSLKYTAVMYPYYNGLRTFGQADLDYLHELYGNSNIPHRWKEIITKRILGI